MTNKTLAPTEHRRIEEAFEGVHYAKFLGMRLGEVEHGRAEIHLAIEPHHTQNRGVVHGGVIASVIDTASAIAAMTVLGEAEETTTIDLTIHYLRPLTAGETTASAKIMRSGKRVITLSVELHDEAHRLVATAITSYLRLT